MLPLLKRHEIQVLRRAGHTSAEIARIAGVSLNTVRRVDAEPPITSASERVQTGRLPVGRPSNTDPFREFVTNLLLSEPSLPTAEVLRRARLIGFLGQKSALYELARSVRPKLEVPFVHDKLVSGELSLHDSGQAFVRFTNGQSSRLYIFASRLAYSRWLEVSLLREWTTETVCRTLANHFVRLGGVPMLSIFNRTKGFVVGTTEDGHPELDIAFGTFMLDLGVGVELSPSRVGLERELGNLVGSVKRGFLAGRRLANETDMKVQLGEWLTQQNSRVRSRQTGMTAREARAVEGPRLRPLPSGAEKMALRRPIVVGPTGHVAADGALYPMPREAIGTAGTIYLYPDAVTIVAGLFKATYLRTSGGEPGEEPGGFQR